MIKLIFNRFGGEVLEQTAKYHIIAEAEAKGTDKTAADIKNVKKAITEVSTTPLTISTKDIGSSVNKINEIKTLITNLKNTKVDFSGSLSGLRESGLLDALPNGIKSSVEQLANLQNIINDPTKFAAFCKDLSSLSKGLSDIDNKGKSATTAQTKLKDALKALKDPIQSITKVIKKLDYTQLVNMWRTIRRISTGLVGIIENAAGYEESLNLYKMALGEYEEKGTEWAKNISDKLMLDVADIYQYTGAFFNLTKGMGVTGDAAYKMATNLTQLTYDMASYLNISNEAAQAKIQSTMAGQSRAVATVGVATQMASLQELAYSLNIKKSVKEMTQREKTYLRYIQLMRQTEKMQGDLGRTMITPANSIRVLKNQINLLARSIGQVLVPILMHVIPYIIAFTNVLRNLINTFSKYKVAAVDYDKISFSFEDAADGADNLDKLGSSAKKAGKSVSESLAPFDELNNVISESDSVGSASGSGGADTIDSSVWDSLLPEYDMLQYYTDELNNKAKDLEGTVSRIAGVIAGIVGASLLGSAVIKLAELIKAVQTLHGAWKTVQTVTGGIAGNITKILTAIALVATGKVMENKLISDMYKNADTNNGDINEMSSDEWVDFYTSIGSFTAAGATLGIGGGPLGILIGAGVGTIIGSLDVLKKGLTEMDTAAQKASADVGQLWYNTSLCASANEKVAISLSQFYSGLEQVLAPIDSVEKLYSNLRNIVDETGKVKAGHEAEAKAIVESLNSALGTNIELRNGQIKGYDTVCKKIDNLIEKKRAEVQLSYYEKQYTQGLIDESSAIDALTTNYSNYKDAIDKVKKSTELSGIAASEVTDKYNDADKQFMEAGKHYSEVIRDKMAWEDAYQAILEGDYARANQIFKEAADKRIEYTLKGLVKSTELVNGELGEKEIAAWAYVAKESRDLTNAALAEIGDEDTRNAIIQAMKDLGIELETNGAEAGEDYSSSFIVKAQKYLNGNHLEVEVEETPDSSETILDRMKKAIKGKPVNVETGVETPSDTVIDKARNAIKNKFNKNPITLDLTTEGSWIQKAKNAIAGIKFKAGGGYLDSGDLFFANENGMPEYITSIGGKSAVVNQQQMVQALTNAITAGFQQFNGGQANNVVVYVGDKKLYEGQGEYQTRQNDRYGTTVVKI